MPTLTDEQLETQVRAILVYHKGKDHRISRWELVDRIFGPEAAADRSNNNPYDRRIREAIAKWREHDLIVSSSSVGGYWLAADFQDVELIAEEYVSRSREMEERARNLRRRGAEVFGPQMPLPFGRVN
jgi:hypothetical protein